MSGTEADFTTVTETPGVNATESELRHIYTRYAWAGGYVKGKRVLELGCGSGPGLGFLRECGASAVHGTDFEPRNLEHAREHYRDRDGIRCSVMDAQAIEVEPGSVDVILLFEAIYYLRDQKAFVECCRSALAPGGQVLVSTVNPEWPGFNPSRFSTSYPSAGGLERLFVDSGFSVELFAGFPDDATGMKSRALRMLRRSAVKMRLIPPTMKGKQFLKRVFYGKMQPVPNEIRPGDREPEELVAIDPGATQGGHVFLYAVATRKD